MRRDLAGPGGVTSPVDATGTRAPIESRRRPSFELRPASGRAEQSPAAAVRRAPTVLGVGIAVALVAVVAFQRAYVTPDSVYGLIWGRDIAHGDLPSFDHGPTPHPLTIAAGALTALLGDHASYDVTYVLFGPLALGALAASVFAVARCLASPAAGAISVLLLLTSAPLLAWAASARYDVLFGALVISALAVELSRPRAGPVPLILLSVGGLIRPEAWLLAALYLLWRLPGLGRRERVLYAAVVAAAPCAWLAMDATVTGDPLWSLHKTESASDDLYGRYSRAENLGQGAKNLLELAGPFALIAAPFAWVVRARAGLASIRLVGALLLVSGGLFLLLVAGGMASSARYLLLPACLIAVLAGVVAGSWRRFSGPIAVAGIVLLALATIARGSALIDTRERFRAVAGWTQEARRLAARPDVRQLLAQCPQAALSRKIAYTWTFWAGRPLDRWLFDEHGATSPDVYVAPATAEVASALLTRERFDLDAGFTVPDGMRPGPASPAWRLHLAPGSSCAALAGRSSP